MLLKIKKILIPIITLISLLFTEIITNNVSASHNSTLTNYPKYMRETWWYEDAKIIISKHTINNPINNPPFNNKKYLHKLTKSNYNSSNADNWVHATYNKDNLEQKWLANDSWHN